VWLEYLIGVVGTTLKIVERRARHWRDVVRVSLRIGSQAELTVPFTGWSDHPEGSAEARQAPEPGRRGMRNRCAGSAQAERGVCG
jgi:hypothetical protein